MLIDFYTDSILVHREDTDLYLYLLLLTAVDAPYATGKTGIQVMGVRRDTSKSLSF